MISGRGKAHGLMCNPLRKMKYWQNKLAGQNTPILLPSNVIYITESRETIGLYYINHTVSDPQGFLVYIRQPSIVLYILGWHIFSFNFWLPIDFS